MEWFKNKDIINVLNDNIKTNFSTYEFKNNSNKEVLLTLKKWVTLIFTPKSEPKTNTVLIATSKIIMLSILRIERTQTRVKIKTSNLSIYGCYFP